MKFALILFIFFIRPSHSEWCINKAMCERKLGSGAKCCLLGGCQSAVEECTIRTPDPNTDAIVVGGGYAGGTASISA